MFGYYGSKSKIAKLYPYPQFETLIEPFAGSARYALHGENWKRKVKLFDLDNRICMVWDYLIRVSEYEILALPDIPNGAHLDTFKLTQEQKLLIGCCIQSASGFRKTASKVGNFNTWNRDKNRIAKTLHKVRHWTIENKGFSDIDNEIATWFIDPPYEKKGIYYKCSSKKINFQDLANWTKSRTGQVIACENLGATWLPFKPLCTITGAAHRKNVEAIWTNTPEGQS